MGFRRQLFNRETFSTNYPELSVGRGPPRLSYRVTPSAYAPESRSSRSRLEVPGPPFSPDVRSCHESHGVVVRPTLKDVARIAGVHFATASLALRRHPRISDTTCQRVHDAAARVGYRPDEVYSALSRHRTKLKSRFAPAIAYVTNRSEKNRLFDTAHHRRLVAGARAQAEAMGYRFELLSVDEGAHTSTSLQKYLQKLGISGVVIGAFQPGRASLSLDWTAFSVVKIDSRQVGPALPFVSVDQLQGVRTAFRELQRLGYKRIGLAIGESDEESTDDMHLSGLYLAQHDVAATQRVRPLLFPRGTVEKRIVIKLLRRWIREERVDAVMSNWTNIRSMVRHAGYSSPGQVACACLCLARPLPGFAGILANFEAVGQRAVALLASQMRSGARGISEYPTTTYVEGHWRNGASASRQKQKTRSPNQQTRPARSGR